jgi:hypothetical protein
MLTSLVSAVMLAGIGPVKLFLAKCLITLAHGSRGRASYARCSAMRSRSDACAASAASPAARRDAHERERGQRGDRRRHAAGEAVLSERPAHNVLIRTRESGGRPHGRRRGVQLDQPGERCDARRDQAGEAVS